MKMLLVNLPFLEVKNGELWSGTNAGSCWPYSVLGHNTLVPFPFFMGWSASYCRAHGIDTDIYDGVARHDTTLDLAEAFIMQQNPDILVLELNSHMLENGIAFARQIKRKNGSCKIVLTGPAMHAYAENILERVLEVDHIVSGEYDLALLKIARGDIRRIIKHEYVDNLDAIDGVPGWWLPYRDSSIMGAYCDPSMVHTPIQIQVNTSRGCFYQCTYCSWPATMYRRRRARSAPAVLAEIREAIRVAPSPVQSIFFDDEMFNAGDPKRLAELSAGLKELRIPWSFMGRIDTSTKDQIRMFVEAGCVGMRFGIETFHQPSLDAVRKKLDAGKSLDNCRWILGNFSGIQVRLLMMTALPESTPETHSQDREFAESLKDMGEKNGNVVDLQWSACQVLPGTELWNVTYGKGFNGHA